MKVLTLLPLVLVLTACGSGSDTAPGERHTDPNTRFYSDCARPGEFLSPTDLPAIPPSFDEDVQ